jgi:hypothetical protein
VDSEGACGKSKTPTVDLLWRGTAYRFLSVPAGMVRGNRIEEVDVNEPDVIMVRIGEGIDLGQRGERAAARALFSQVWEEIGPTGDAFHRCALAHSMADVQDDPYEELVWDLRALEAADSITDERARRAGVATPVSGLYPSLHLNLGEVYRKLGQFDRARDHLERGRAAAVSLSDDGYGRMIMRALDRLAGRLGTINRAGTADRVGRQADLANR